MALLSKYVLTKMQEVFVANSINSYLYIAPQDAVSPFVTMFPYSVTTEYTFNEIMDTVNIQVSMFDNRVDCQEDLIDLAGTIFDLFSDYSITDGTSTIFCTHIVQQRGPEYLSKEEFWQFTMELEFKTIKSKI